MEHSAHIKELQMNNNYWKPLGAASKASEGFLKPQGYGLQLCHNLNDKKLGLGKNTGIKLSLNQWGFNCIV